MFHIRFNSYSGCYFINKCILLPTKKCIFIFIYIIIFQSNNTINHIYTYRILFLLLYKLILFVAKPVIQNMPQKCISLQKIIKYYSPFNIINLNGNYLPYNINNENDKFLILSKNTKIIKISINAEQEIQP